LAPKFLKLNDDRNAQLNAPAPEIEQSGGAIVLRFYLNHQFYPGFVEEDVGALIFVGVVVGGLGPQTTRLVSGLPATSKGLSSPACHRNPNRPKSVQNLLFA
jgi:hypothetical protein